jgi:hypothetical protein
MDDYYKKSDCENKSILFSDEEKFKEYYNILYTWDEIKQNILVSYTQPIHKKNISRKSSGGKGSGNGKGSDKGSGGKDSFRNLFAKNIYVSNLYTQNIMAVKNTLFYMFYKYKTFYYIRIRSGQMEFFYIYNKEYTNPLRSHLKKLSIKSKKQNYFSPPEKWIDLGAVIRMKEPTYDGFEIDFYYYEVKYFISQILKKYGNKIWDCDFIVSHKDRLSLKRNLTESSEEIVGSDNYPLPNKFKFREYIPILSFSGSERYADIPIPTPDEILYNYSVYFPSRCIEHNYNIETKWNKKTPIAVFRGSFTGSSANINNNPRLALAWQSYQWNLVDNPPILDAGITSFNGRFRGRKELENNYIELFNMGYSSYLKKPQLNYEEQSLYKYVIYVEGNVAAYRAARLFSFGSVVLWIPSHKYKIWFEFLLKDKVNCIFVKRDLSDLRNILEWLLVNDNKAKKIAQAGMDMYKKYLTREATEMYMFTLLNKLT